MRITVSPGGDLDVAAGATVAELREAAQPLGVVVPPRPWCGDGALGDEHRAGDWPLVHGAVLAAAPAARIAPPGAAHLIVTAGPDAGVAVPLGDHELTIGRGSECDLSVADPALSRLHARARGGERPRVRDAGSTNGTATPPRRARRKIDLTPGTAVTVGRSILELDDGAATERAAAAPPAAGPSGDGAPDPQHLPLGAASAWLAGGVLGAAATGRWWIAAVGAAYPAWVAAQELRRRSHATEGPTAALSPLSPGAARWWRERAPIAVTGRPADARGFARAVCLALDGRPSQGPHEPWMRWLPSPVEVEVVEPGQPSPPWCVTVVEATPQRAEVRSRDGHHVLPPVRVSADAAEAVARRAASALHTRTLPERVRWADLQPFEIQDAPRAPRVAVAAGPGGAATVDFARAGHVLVAGAAGAGKTTLLETLTCAAALAAPPRQLGIAVIDRAGGALANACAALPHLIAPAAPDGAGAALAAVTAALDDRERAMSAGGYGEISRWEAAGGAPARLLIAIDGLDRLGPDAAAAVTRVTRDGARVGVHVAIATERPAGAASARIRDACGATIGLRCASEAESLDLLGSPAAAHLDAGVPGRAIFAQGGRVETVQVALPSVTPRPAARLPDAPEEAPRDLAAAACARWGG